MGKRMLRGWQGLKAGWEVGGGEGGQEGGVMGRGGYQQGGVWGVETGRGNLEGGNGEGSNRDDR